MATNFWEAGSMKSYEDTRINTSVRPNSGSSWFNWADAGGEEEDVEETKMEEAGIKEEYVEGKYEKLRRLKAAG